MAANLKEVRERIRSVQNTQQITKAMKMVSAAKLRRAQTAITQMRPYADKLKAMLRNILSNMDGGDAETSFGQARPVEKVAIVVVTSNRGLAGAFNTNIAKAAAASINEKYADVLANGNLTIIPIGKKGFDYFRKRYPQATIIRDYIDLFTDLTFENVSRASRHLMDGFENNTYDVIEVAYGRFKNAAMQFPEVEQFLPVAKIDAGEDDSNTRAFYIFEPGEKELLDYLVPSILQTQFFKYNLDTHASEHGARMTAMDKATENAQELLRDLRIKYNKARQESITNEILEIVSGASALESK